MKKLFPLIVLFAIAVSMPSFAFTLADDDYNDLIIKAKSQENIQDNSVENKTTDIEDKEVPQSVKANEPDGQIRVKEAEDGEIGKLKDSVRKEMLGERWVYPNENQQNVDGNSSVENTVEPVKQNLDDASAVEDLTKTDKENLEDTSEAENSAKSVQDNINNQNEVKTQTTKKKSSKLPTVKRTNTNVLLKD